jgi:hypothetical protein
MRRIAAVGFAIWLGATVVLRIAGQFVFGTGGTDGTLLVLLVSVPLMVAVARAVLGGLPPAERPLGAIALVAPGMLLDTFSTIWFTRVFPNIRQDAAPTFGGWLLLCNVVVLLTAALGRAAPIITPAPSNER